MHPLLRRLAQEWDAAGVRWMYLRPPTDPERPEGDVDLLVAPSTAALAFGAAEALGFVPLPAWGYGADRFFLAYHPDTEAWVWLHVARDLHFGRYGTVRTSCAAALLQRRVAAEVGWLPAPDDRFWLLLLHCLLDKGFIKPEHRNTLQNLAPDASDVTPLADVFSQIAAPGWSGAQALAAVRAGEWEVLERHAHTLVPALPADRPGLQQRILAIRMLRMAGRARDGVRRGMRVALMGPDGAGKSTLSRGIRQTFFFPSRSVYMGTGTGKIARIARVFGRVRVFGYPILHRPPFTFIAYNLTLWLRYLTGTAYRLTGRLVIFDRYTYDAWLPMPGTISRLKAIALRFQARVVPAPDLVLVLDLPGETMFERKGEFDPEHLERQRQHLLSLRDRVKELEVVDATRPADVVRRDAVERIWRRYQRRWAR